MPASAPIAAESANESVITQLVLMPTSAPPGGWRGGEYRLAVRVFVKKSHSRTKTATAPASTQRLCGRIVAPMMRIGVSPEKAGKRWSCLSKTSCATPRMKIEAPMVMMMSDTTGAPRAGSIASLLSATPTPRHRDGDERSERQRHARHVGEDGDHAAEHHELALGEVHHVGGVVDDGEAESDERVDSADRHAGQQELHQFGHFTLPGRGGSARITNALTRLALPRARRGGVTKMARFGMRRAIEVGINSLEYTRKIAAHLRIPKAQNSITN